MYMCGMHHPVEIRYPELFVQRVTASNVGQEAVDSEDPKACCGRDVPDLQYSFHHQHSKTRSDDVREINKAKMSTFGFGNTKLSWCAQLLRGRLSDNSPRKQQSTDRDYLC